MDIATKNAVLQMANREVCINTFRNYSDGSIFDYIDYGNTTDVTYKTDIKYATGGQGGGRRMGFEGSPAVTMKFSTQIITPKLMAMLSGSDIISGTNIFRHKVITSSTSTGTSPATTITFSTSEQPMVDTLGVYPHGVELTESNKIKGTYADGIFTFTTPASTDSDYDCFYECAITDAQTVIFRSDTFPNIFIWDGETPYKDDYGIKHTEVFHAYKVQPQQNFTFNYANSGDPGKLEITFDLFADSKNRIFSKTLLPVS